MPKVFTLTEARELLPTVKALTADAVRDAERLTTELRGLDESGDAPAVPDKRAELDAKLSEVVAGWAAEIRALGVEAKGLWLVDFDNGDGYYCWKYPEEALLHFHDYDSGFSGRMRIV